MKGYGMVGHSEGGSAGAGFCGMALMVGLGLVLLAAWGRGGCEHVPTSPPPPPPPRSMAETSVPFSKGLGFWPTDYSPGYLDRCFALLRLGSDLVFVQRDLFRTSENRALLEVFDAWLDRGRRAGLAKYIALEPFALDRKVVKAPEGWKGGVPLLSDPAIRQAFRDEVMRIVRRHRPEYLNIGVEVNMYYHHRPDDYENFRTLFAEVRDEIRRASPGTKVFTSYQYEFLLGIFPGTNGKAQWELLADKRLDQDLVGISTYPLFLRGQYAPALMPSDYYAPLKARADRPLMFVEVGWYSSESVTPPSSPDKQAAFVRSLPSLLSGLDVEVVCWISLVDLKDLPALASLKRSLPQFFSLALADADVRPKPAWQAWLAMRSAGKARRSLGPNRGVTIGRGER